MRVLVCDRDPATVALISDELKGLGHDVAIAYDAVAASREIRAFWPDLVILDFTTVGLGVVREIRAENWPQEIAVIVLTACPDDAAILEIYAVGADMALTKPFNPRELVLFRPRD